MGRPTDARLTPEIAQRDLRADRQRRGAGGLDRQPREPVRAGPARQELPHRQTSSTQEQVQAARKEDVLNALSEIVEDVQNPARRITRDGRKTLDAARRCDHLVARGAKAYSTAMKVEPRPDCRRAFRSSSARSKSIPNSRWRTRSWGCPTAVSARRCSRPRARRKAYQLRDRASDRERFFITTQLRSSGDRQSRTRAADADALGADLSARSPRATDCWRGFVYARDGTYELCLDEAPKAIALDPDVIFPYVNLRHLQPVSSSGSTRRSAPGSGPPSASRRIADVPSVRLSTSRS